MYKADNGGFWLKWGLWVWGDAPAKVGEKVTRRTLCPQTPISLSLHRLMLKFPFWEGGSSGNGDSVGLNLNLDSTSC